MNGVVLRRDNEDRCACPMRECRRRAIRKRFVAKKLDEARTRGRGRCRDLIDGHHDDMTFTKRSRRIEVRAFRLDRPHAEQSS